MRKFDILTQYIPIIQADIISEWIIDEENDGTQENPKQIPFVQLSENIRNFIDDVYVFEDSNKDMGLTHYTDILIDNGLECDLKSIKQVDVSDLNAQCVLALIMRIIRAERFCDGVVLEFFRNGCILKWLERLKSID